MPRKTIVKQKPASSRSVAAVGKRARKAGAPKLGAETCAGSGPLLVNAEERHAMIAQAAYFRFERRGGNGGCAELDWLEAEAEIDRALSASPLSGAHN